MEPGQSDDSAPPLPRRIRAARDLRGLGQAQVVRRLQNPISTSASVRSRPARFGHPDRLSKIWPKRWMCRSSFSRRSGPVKTHLLPTSVIFGPPPQRSGGGRRRWRCSSVTWWLRSSHTLGCPKFTSRYIPSARTHLGTRSRRSHARCEWHWQLGTEEPIPHVVRELERHGVAVARSDDGAPIGRRILCQVQSSSVVLLTEDKSNYVRSRFDAAHELAHLVGHAQAETGSRLVERQAHDFAASFLLPEPVALGELPRQLDPVGWSKLAALKSHWGISMAALLYRSRDLKIIGPDAYRNAVKLMSARGWRTTEPGDREMGPPEAPLLIERALRRIEVEGGLSANALVGWAHLPQEDTLQLIKAAGDRRPIVEL